jgi:hypothetical protein
VQKEDAVATKKSGIQPMKDRQAIVFRKKRERTQSLKRKNEVPALKGTHQTAQKTSIKTR